MQISQGQRLPLSSLMPGSQLTLSINVQSPHVLDFVCFGIDAQGKLSDDRYMVFFNQPTTPCNGVSMSNGGDFTLDLSKLPTTIDRLVFTTSIDGTGAMRDIQASSFSIKSLSGDVLAKCAFSGATFADEKAIMIVELYRKSGEWRLASNLQGFNAGLEALVKHFGGDVADEPAPAPAPAPVTAPVTSKISLEKKIGEAAPHLISLAKKAQVSLEKAKLTDVKARVGLVLDASGSMNNQYQTGRVQEVVNRLLPLALHFDDDGTLDCWAFGAETLQLSAVTLANHKDFINTDSHGWKDWKIGARYNDEPKAIKKVIDFYKQSRDTSPIYILFISDGGVSASGAIKKLMIEAAKLPIFWQFVGIGGHNYGILEKLDTMTGRVVDNCGFFALDDLHDISEEQLYDKLMEEFPQWLKDAKAKGIVF
ncbi:VWA domain-containing protein [Pseudomonas sp. NPDC087342]|uniref:VWA domain-containing protein n=1 Tax=Pseudomonas sp. NPDC087342 TaxID=3364437 RepID=UPI003811D912